MKGSCTKLERDVCLKEKKLVGKMEGIHVGGLTVLANKNLRYVLY